jgi:hypothetical protein
MLHLIEQHITPDGLLTLKVGRDDDGDVCHGFDGFSWHTHADILASLSGLGEDEAVRPFVGDLIAGRAIIAISRVRGEIRGVWVADEPAADEYKPDNETIEFKYWDGRVIAEPSAPPEWRPSGVS